jgi:hypothetical protein
MRVGSQDEKKLGNRSVRTLVLAKQGRAAAFSTCARLG